MKRSQYMAILKVIALNAVPSLPAAAGPGQPVDPHFCGAIAVLPAPSRCTSCSSLPQEAAASVVDDTATKASTPSTTTRRRDPVPCCRAKFEIRAIQTGGRLRYRAFALLVRPDFAAFNANVRIARYDIETALDSCSLSIRLVFHGRRCRKRLPVLCKCA